MHPAKGRAPGDPPQMLRPVLRPPAPCSRSLDKLRVQLPSALSSLRLPLPLDTPHATVTHESPACPVCLDLGPGSSCCNRPGLRLVFNGSGARSFTPGGAEDCVQKSRRGMGHSSRYLTEDDTCRARSWVPGHPGLAGPSRAAYCRGSPRWPWGLGDARSRTHVLGMDKQRALGPFH